MIIWLLPELQLGLLVRQLRQFLIDLTQSLDGISMGDTLHFDDGDRSVSHQ
jgi:hypothetical protein